ncbi:MAG: peptide-methionine (S)-S-oxide reductase [Bacteroidota bacterium]
MSFEEDQNIIALSGGCHWCTEGIFVSLRGVIEVAQGWIRSESPNDVWAEGILAHYDPDIISTADMIEVHLETHAATSKHSLRWKYRSAIYYRTVQEEEDFRRSLVQLAPRFDRPLITEVLPFVAFKLNQEEYLDYYRRNPEKPFCQRYISPKLEKLKLKNPGLLS